MREAILTSEVIRMNSADHEKRNQLSRRALLKGTAGAALGAAAAALTGALGGRAQVTGLEPDGAVPPFRLALGAMTDLDRKQYIHNMEIVSHLPGATIEG